MVQITVDTQLDSANTIRRVISLLEEELAKKNDAMMTSETILPPESTPLHQQQTSSQTPTSTVGNPFDMFGTGLPSSGGIQQKSEPLPVSIPETQVYDSDSNSSDSNSSDSSIANSAPEAVPMRNPMALFDEEPVKPKIILDAPQPKSNSHDFEGSARFASQVGTAQELLGERPKKKGFFTDLDQF